MNSTLILQFEIPGCPRTKKNSQVMVGDGKGRHPVPSTAYRKYERDSWLLARQDPERMNGKTIACPIRLECHYYMETPGAVDLVGLLQATQDFLVSRGTIQDDNCTIVANTDGSRVHFDARNPRTEIFIFHHDEPVDFLNQDILQAHAEEMKERERARRAARRTTTKRRR